MNPVTVRIFDINQHKVTCKFLDMCPTKDSTAEMLGGLCRFVSRLSFCRTGFNSRRPFSFEFMSEEDPEYSALLKDNYLSYTPEQNVFIVNPVYKQQKLEFKKTPKYIAESMSEAKALVDTLGAWKVVDTTDIDLRYIHPLSFFPSSKVNSLRDIIQKNTDITVVFVNWAQLSGVHVNELQTEWNKIVVDRFSVILHIFDLHANSRETRLQVTLAQIPYLRSRLVSFHEGNSRHMESAYLEALGSKSTCSLIKKESILNAREKKIRDQLNIIRKKREFLRQNRRKRDIPLIAVIGYTNAGKTALIRNLSKDRSVEPCNRLFATLNITHHGAYLPTNMKAIFIDTIGFITDIPTSFFAAFKATLQDCMDCDQIVHVIDSNHSNRDIQFNKVMSLLDSLQLSAHLKNSIIHVATKVDLLSQKELDEFHELYPNALSVSNVDLTGLDALASRIHESIVINFDMIKKKIKISQSESILSWLYSNAVVESIKENPRDPDTVLVDAIFTPSNWGKFQTMFQKV